MMPEDRTKKYYETHASDYFLATHAIKLQPLWEKLSEKLNPDALILDLGCGSGRDVRYFAGQGYQVIGLDYASGLLKLAKTFAQQPLVLADFIASPFRDNTFDAGWAIGSLLHLPRQLISAALTEIHRILKPGSILLTSIKKGSGEKTELDGRHCLFYQPDEWANRLMENGYEIIIIEEAVEIRKRPPGAEERITWIVCLAKTG